MYIYVTECNTDVLYEVLRLHEIGFNVRFSIVLLFERESSMFVWTNPDVLGLVHMYVG